MNKKNMLLFLRLIVSFGLIGYFLYTLAKKQGGLGAALQQFGSAFSGASAQWLIPAALLHLVGFSLVSLRWKILLRAQGTDTSFQQLFTYYFMAAFFNTFLPSTIGGDAVRAMESKKLTGNTTTSVMVVVIERLTGLMALAAITAAAVIIKILTGTGQPKIVWLFLAAVTAGFFIAGGLAHPKIAPAILRIFKKIFPPKLFSLAEQAHSAAAVYYRRPAALFSALGVSVIFQLNIVLYYFLLAKGLNQNPDPLDFMLNVPVMIFLLMTVPAINGLGVRTASFKGLMKFPAAFALALEFIDLGLRIGYGLLGGLFFLFHRRTGGGGSAPRRRSPFGA